MIYVWYIVICFHTFTRCKKEKDCRAFLLKKLLFKNTLKHYHFNLCWAYCHIHCYRKRTIGHFMKYIIITYIKKITNVNIKVIRWVYRPLVTDQIFLFWFSLSSSVCYEENIYVFIIIFVISTVSTVTEIMQEE